MINNRPASSGPARRSKALPNLQEWVLSLPWVVERPRGLGARRVRSFAVDCDPLNLRRLWLMTDLRPRWHFHGVDIAVIVPLEVASFFEEVGWGRPLSPTPAPARRVFVAVSDDATATPHHLEAMVLAAYDSAMSEL